MKEVSVKELKKLIDEKADFQLIDIREPHEVEIVSIVDAEFIPMATIPDNLDNISHTKQVFIMCKSGRRSENITKWLETNGYDNIYNVRGGILAYVDEIDTSLTKY